MTTSPTELASAYALATTEEITRVRGILAAAGLAGDSVRFAYLGLLDPPRRAATEEAAVERRFRVFLHDISGAAPKDVVVSVTREEVESVTDLDTSVTGELPVLEEEFAVVEEI